MSNVVCLTEYRGRKAVRERQNREYMMNLTREVLHMIKKSAPKSDESTVKA